MNHYCCVPQCTSWVKKNPELSFHTFPKKGKSKVIVHTRLGSKELVDRRLVWIRNLKIVKKVSDYMRVCSLHFERNDFLQNERIKRRTLKSFAVPSQNLPAALCSTDPEERTKRTLKSIAVSSQNFPVASCSTDPEEIIKRGTLKSIAVPSQNLQVASCSTDPVPSTSRASRTATREFCPEETPVIQPECEDNPALEDEEDREAAAEALLALLNSQVQTEDNCAVPSTRDSSVQVNVPKILTLCEIIADSDEKLKNFTGINNFKIFDSIVEIFEKCYKDRRTHRLSVKQRIMLVFTKFKTSLTYVTLGSLFGISSNLAKTYICEMVPDMAAVLKPLIYFPSQNEIVKNMPVYFSDFQDVRVVLDCTEIRTQTPKCLCCRIRFYSHYKSHITVKFMTGMSPGGLITFVSRPYGGRASDKIIFEESGVVSLLDPYKDAFMVDKGFLIEDICNIYKIKLFRPPFLKKKLQLSTEEAILNAKIAAARVHIERSNQRLKIFKIFDGKLDWTLIPLVEDIFSIICAVTNLSSPILAESRFLLK